MNNDFDLEMLEEPTATIQMIRPVSPTFPPAHFEWQLKSQTVVKTTLLEPSIELLNIPFIIRHGDDHVFLESPQWDSLRTHGNTVREAISNMLELIRDVIEEYIFVDTSELTQDAIEFRNFLIQKLFV